MSEKIRILIIDDSREIHHDLLQLPKEGKASSGDITITTVVREGDGLKEIQKGIATGNPFALAFINLALPSVLDRIENFFMSDPDLQLVICLDVSECREGICEQFSQNLNLFTIDKPLDADIVRQLINVLAKKWQLFRQSRVQIKKLEERLKERTQSLEETLLVYRSTLESYNEGILVISNGNIVEYNNKLIEMWQIPLSLFKDRNAFILLNFISKKIKNKNLFLNLLNNLINNNYVIDHEKFITLDNRKIELNSHLYTVKGSPSGIIWSFRDVTNSAVLEEKIQFQATHDALTGLANRILLFDRTHMAIAHAERHAMTFALLYMDLNHFKLINDSLGHAAGDELLIEIAARLKASMRKTDTLARIGGDEFVIVTSAIKEIADIDKFVRKLLSNFDVDFVIKGHQFSIGSSIGVALYPQDGKTPEELITNADAAMYSSKGISGNLYQYYSENFKIKNQERLSLQSDFQAALKNGEFFLCYQPQFDLASKRLNSIEALVRWRHPQKGILLPIDFIPLAEETGFIIPLGEWILKTACEQNKLWQSKGVLKVPVAVNLGARQLRQADFVKTIKKVLKEIGLKPHYLQLELTESIVINLIELRKVIVELQELGIKIALDDFGSEYSSLNYLRKIDIDLLKIDKSFIANINKVKRDELIIEAIISMGHVLGVDVVAEGVETQNQINFLAVKHCREAQGYFLGKPLECHQIEKLLANMPQRPG
jgi:diguanylate cyclase (GGDEF)-like protein